MKKSKIISLSISLFVFAVGIIITFQLYPYLELRNCKINTSIINKTIIVKNNGDHVAEFPKIESKIYRDNIYVGNFTIEDFKIKPKETAKEKIKIESNLSLNNTIKLLNTTMTHTEGKVYLPILNFKLGIPFKMDRYDNGTTIVYFMGRKIVR